MSYLDYLDGLRDGFNIGFKAGCKVGQSSGYLSGYKDGYDDASLGLPYRPQDRLNEFSLNMPKIKPLPEYDPIELKIDPLPKIEIKPIVPKYEPIKAMGSWSRYDDEKPGRNDGFGCKDPWEKW